MTVTATTTSVFDLPDVILSNIFAAVSDPRSRNSLALVCRKFFVLERSTRTSLTLRGNVRNLLMVPMCFDAVTNLDLSLLSPWGNEFLALSPDGLLFAQLLGMAFPLVTKLTVYARSPSTLQILLPQWPGLSHLKLIRWHQRSHAPPRADFAPVFEQCPKLTSLDLSHFYYHTEGLPQAIQGHRRTSAFLQHLDLLTVSFNEGFKSHEIREITSACPNLKKFLIVCMFDPRYVGSDVGDETLLAIATNCPKLSLLHLADTKSLATVRGDPEDEGFSSVDARISELGLHEFFTGLPLLEELVLDVCNNVRGSALALEVLSSKCLKLRVLKLSQFHSVCNAVESQLDGVALCSELESLSIKNSADLDDMRLIEIARGCHRLVKFEVEGCKRITAKGMRTMSTLLRQTLVEVKISCCKNLNAVSTLHSLEPICDRIQRLHVDCVWDGFKESCEEEEILPIFDLNEAIVDPEDTNRRKKCKYSWGADCSYSQSYENGYLRKPWRSLRYLSLWIGVGELLNPLPMIGLEDCPNLEEIRIKVEGDSRIKYKPSELEFGLSCLACYPRLSKLQLDCSDTIGYALTAPSGQMDLSLWERFFLNEIHRVRLNEFDYRPPQDRDVNQSSIWLPGAGLLGQCVTLRKLIIHGTAQEHFLGFFLNIPYLREFQLREDYYPAPENDSTEVRVDSCSRFEDALNGRRIPD
ncbi:F-box/LRR-repeat MAX2 A [Tripterygium wilfordii]|uniref:F-box/LRR-repeat MAX2 A n=1 Tax=Tripterygium wilfordii TaxID=458696 RepID=A0A7J7CBC5_TRIWF|nr:F-box/LRR-repeat MAX2 homolog A [Tripterygium wilfordii]KAF5731390.1 F-box/LRR-repeat MAX2 A [Tripterygium wilfordii]